MDAIELMRSALTTREKKPVVTMDAAMENDEALGADDFTIKEISLLAGAAVQQWAETDDLGDDETYAERLMALLVGVADANKDGYITEDEQGVLDVALNAVWDYLTLMGVTQEDAGSLLNDWDTETADRVRELVAAYLPEGDLATDDLDNFVFGESDQEAEDLDGYTAEDEWDATPELDNAGYEEVKTLDGDFKGHPFRGNQYEKGSAASGSAVGASKRAKYAESRGDAKSIKKSHASAHYAHRSASVAATTKKAKIYHKKMAKFHGQRGGVALDSVALDAVYKMKTVIQGGKKMRIKKRISGQVRLTAKQKLGIRKMQMKSHSAGARMHRMKSMRMRTRMGM